MIRDNDHYGGIFLPPTCKINYVKMQENDVNMQDNYVFMQNNHVYTQDRIRAIYGPLSKYVHFTTMHSIDLS